MDKDEFKFPDEVEETKAKGGEVEDNFEEVMEKLNASVSKKREPKKERKQVKER
jgi:hypothetical protein